jgi:zinc protease
LSAQTEPEDLELQLQILAAQMTDPGYRIEAVTIYQHDMPARLNDFVHTLAGPEAQMSQFLKGGDERYGIPIEEKMLSYTADDVRSWLAPQLNSSYLELTVVGDFPDTVVDYILSTFGALAPRADAPDHFAYNKELSFPTTPQSVTYTYDSKDRQAQVVLAFEIMAMNETTINDVRYMNVIANAFDQRLFNEIREELGAAYSPGASSNPYSGFNHGEFTAYALVSPENATTVGERIQQIATSIAQDGITDDQLLRATEPILSNLQQTLTSNGYWMSVLDGSQAEPFTLDWAQNRDEVYANITIEAINDLAAKYVSSDKSILVSMLPVGLDGSGTTADEAVTDGDGNTNRDRILFGLDHNKGSKLFGMHF